MIKNNVSCVKKDITWMKINVWINAQVLFKKLKLFKILKHLIGLQEKEISAFLYLITVWFNLKVSLLKDNVKNVYLVSYPFLIV